MRPIKLVTIVAAAALLVPAASASHPPPDTMFRSGDVKQRGKQSTYCWHGTCADYIPTPQKKAVAVEGDRRARIRIKYADKPDDLSLTSWRELDEYGRPTGPSRQIDYVLKPKKFDGDVVGWDAVFHLPKRTGHVYTQAWGFWSDPDGDSSWFFHWKVTNN